MDTLTKMFWLSPTEFVSGDTSLQINHPSFDHPGTIVTCTSSDGVFKWISTGLNLPPKASIQAITLCYQLSGSDPLVPPLSSISQIRISEMGTPNESKVLYDEAVVLHQTNPSRYTANVGGIVPSAGSAVMLSLRLDFKSTSDQIRLGALGIKLLPAAECCCLNVRDFGALGDGHSHPMSERYATLAEALAEYPNATSLCDELDNAAIHAAINFVNASGTGTICFPSGTYLLTTPVEVIVPIAFEGDGLSSVIKMITTPPPAPERSANERCLFHVRSDYVSFTHLAFKGSGTDLISECKINEVTFPCAHRSATQFAIDADPAEDGAETARYGVVENCFFLGDVDTPRESGWLNNGIKLNNPSSGGDVVSHWHIANNTFRNLVLSVAGAGYGILLGTSNHNIIKGNQFFGCGNNKAELSLKRGRHAVYISAGSSYNSVTDNHVEGFNESAIAIYAMEGQLFCTHNIVANNIISNPAVTKSDSGAIDIEELARYNLISGNVIEAPGSHGISVLANNNKNDNIASWNTIIGNIINNAGATGIILKGASHTQVAENTIVSASQASCGAWAAIGVYHDKNVKAVANSIVRNTIGGVVRKSIDGKVPAPSWRAGVSINNTNYYDSKARWLTDTRIFGNVIQPGAGNTYGQRYIAFEGTPDDYLQSDYLRSDTAVNFPLASFTVPGGSGFITHNITVDGATPGDPVIVAYRDGFLPPGVLISGIVSAANQVRVTFANLNAAPQLIDPGILKVTVLDH